MAVKQTAGRDALGEFAPKFAELNDDVLFGKVWSQEELLPLKTRSIVTITALISKGITDSSLKYHLAAAKAHSWFSHLAVEVPGENTSNEWCEPVSDADYAALEN